MINIRKYLFSNQPTVTPAFLLFWVLLLWGGAYALRGYWEPDEARFVYVAREMATSGDWLVPHRHGLEYAHKPPLLFWLINLGEMVFPKPFGSRLPSLLGVLLSLWAVSGIARLWSGRHAALRSVLVLSSALMFWRTCGMGQTDGLLLGLEMAALYQLLKNDHTTPTKMPWSAFLILGLAVLTKGPVGLLIPLGIYLSIRYSVKQETHLRVKHLGLGILIALAIPALWIGGCWLSGASSDYLNELLFTQNVSRAAGELGHRQPIFYFLFHTPLAFMPWTLFLPAAYLTLRKRDPLLLRKLVGWALFVVIFFSIPSSKRNIYIMGALPAMALAIALAWDEIEQRRSLRIIAVTLFSLATIALAALSSVIVAGRLPAVFKASESTAFFLGSLQAWPFILTLIVATAGLTSLIVFRKTWLTAYALSLCLLLSAVGFLILPALNDIKVPDEIIPLAQAYIPATGRLLLYDIYGETLALHADRMGMRCDDDQAMSLAMEEQKHGLAVFLSKHATNLQERFPTISKTGNFRMGSKHYVWGAFNTNQ